MLLLNRFSAGWKNAEDNFHAKLVKNKCFAQSEYLITKCTIHLFQRIEFLSQLNIYTAIGVLLSLPLLSKNEEPVCYITEWDV